MDRASESSPPPPPSFAQVAKRMAGAATNILAIGVVVLLGLLLGREVISWWRADEVARQEAEVASAPPVASPLVTEVGVGESSALALRTAVGDRSAALTALAELAKVELASQAAVPGEVSTEEARLLERLETADCREETAQGSIYEMPGEVPLTIAVAKVANVRRVVFCGLALDKGDNLWSLYGVKRRGITNSAQSPEIPWPPGTQRVMSLASAARGSTLVFVGSGSVEPWKQFYREWLKTENAQVVSDWQRVGTRWQATYAYPASRPRLVELVLSPTTDGRWSGLVTLAPLDGHAQAVSNPQ